MNERSPIEHSSLRPETAQLLDSIESETGIPVLIRADGKIRGYGRAAYIVTDSNPEYHNILVDPAKSRFIDHLVAHESGHILRFYRVQPEDREVPVLTGEHRANALRQLLPEIATLVKQGIAQEAIDKVYSKWLSGTISLISNTPADIRIERRIWQEFPGLRDIQEASLRDVSQSLHVVTGSAIEATTPQSLWRASNALNYALCRATGELLDDESLVMPYRGSWAEKVGEELYQLISGSPDLGLANDRKLSDTCAERLGFRDWYGWRTLDSLQPGFKIDLEE